MTTITTISPSVAKIHRNRANEVVTTESAALADEGLPDRPATCALIIFRPPHAAGWADVVVPVTVRGRAPSRHIQGVSRSPGRASSTECHPRTPPAPHSRAPQPGPGVLGRLRGSVGEGDDLHPGIVGPANRRISVGVGIQLPDARDDFLHLPAPRHRAAHGQSPRAHTADRPRCSRAQHGYPSSAAGQTVEPQPHSEPRTRGASG